MKNEKLKILAVLIAINFTACGAAHAKTPLTTHAIKKAFASVVDIEATKESVGKGDEGFKRYVATRTGVGVIIDSSGIIVTNAHVVMGASKITARLRDKRAKSVKVLRVYPNEDLAFLKISSMTKLPVVTIADSNKVAMGNDVYTVGHSNYLKGTIIHGKILNVYAGKGFGRLSNSGTISVFFDFKAYRGDSGSPVFNKDGALIGLLYGTLQDINKMSFVIPSSVLKPYLISIKSPQKK